MNPAINRVILGGVALLTVYALPLSAEQATPAKPPAPCTIRIATDEVIHPHFGGVGFHCSEHEFRLTQEHLDQVLAKRWHELRPSFARVSDNCLWKTDRRDVQAAYLRMMKNVGTEVYMTTWNPRNVPEGPERVAYAKSVVDYLEYLVRVKSCTNLKYYCMTNELSLKGWGSMRTDLPTFKSYHQCFYDELAARQLDIKLLATDASPVSYWPTIEWASQNMDEITGIYGGHHYINDYALEDVRFYGWFLERIQWACGLARQKGKNFILGEFGSKQDGRVLNGVKQDRCLWYETPQEPLAACRYARRPWLPSMEVLTRWATGRFRTIRTSTPVPTSISGVCSAGPRQTIRRVLSTTVMAC